jgi:hypothetical protein
MSGFMDSVEKHWKNIKKNASGQMDKTVEGVKDAGKAAKDAVILGDDDREYGTELRGLIGEAYNEAEKLAVKALEKKEKKKKKKVDDDDT